MEYFSHTITLLLLSLALAIPSSTMSAHSMAGMAPMSASMPPMTTTPEPLTPVAAAPGPSGLMDDCMSALVNMSDCLSYVTPGSNSTVPDKPCCPELAGLVEGNPVCLCSLLAGNSSSSSSLGINIDVKRALKLPGVCKIKTPDVSLCSMVGVPVAGIPTATPANSPLAGDSPMAAVGAEPTSSHNGAVTSHHTLTGAASFLLSVTVLLHFI